MACLDPDFSALLRGYDLAQLDSHEGAIYALCSDWRLRYFNDGWSRFARDNGGEPTLSARYPLGTPLFDAFTPAPLRAFFEFHYSECLRESRLWSHDYECSSATVYRRFRQLVYPLGSRGVMVVNAKSVERPHAQVSAGNFSAASYRDAAGLVHQCAHCRRIRHSAQHDSWDWVPEWVAQMPPRCSHGLCPTCLVFYYIKPHSTSS